jgi:hypothetical protein
MLLFSHHQPEITACCLLYKLSDGFDNLHPGPVFLKSSLYSGKSLSAHFHQHRLHSEKQFVNFVVFSGQDVIFGVGVDEPVDLQADDGSGVYLGNFILFGEGGLGNQDGGFF